MIRYRTFQNQDPPLVSEIWRAQPPQRARMQPLSTELFEQLVLSKLCFDPQGLILALEDNQPLGFAHAGFGPNDAGDDLSYEMGVTDLVLVAPGPRSTDVAGELLERSEAYLRGKGAKLLYGGEIFPLNPFYLGLLGGSEQPGVLSSDLEAVELFRSHDYEEIDRTLILQRELAGFRPVVDRQRMQNRRKYQVNSSLSSAPKNWWDACTSASFERERYELAPRGGGEPVGSLLCWDIEPLASSWGVKAAGLIDVEIHPEFRRQGLAAFSVGETLRQLQEQSVSLVEVQVMQNNIAAINLYKKLGFEEIDQGLVLRKKG